MCGPSSKARPTVFGSVQALIICLSYGREEIPTWEKSELWYVGMAARCPMNVVRVKSVLNFIVIVTLCGDSICIGKSLVALSPRKTKGRGELFGQLRDENKRIRLAMSIAINLSV